MVALCAVDPMECIYDVRVVTRHKRDVPPVEAVAPPSRSDTSGTRSNHVLIISLVAAGAVLFVMATLFLMFMKRRRADQPIGHDQEFIPTLMDEKSTEEYFKRPPAAAASAPAVTAPSRTHQRTLSVPAMFAKSQDQGNKNDTAENTDQFHQISLVDPESEEKTIKRSLSKGFARLRSSTVSAPITALHRSISLNSHAPYAFISRSSPIHEEFTDALPTATRIRFPDAENGRKPLVSREYSNPWRFSSDKTHVPHRRSTSSAVECSHLSSLAALSAMIDSKKPATMEPSAMEPSAASSDESDDDASNSTVSSDEGFDHIPPHQRYQNFESHSPYPGFDEDSPDSQYNQQETTTNSASAGTSLGPRI